MDVDALLAEADEPPPRQPLASGFNPWKLPKLPEGEINWNKISWHRTLQDKSVEVICRYCGRAVRVHPMHAARKAYCTTSCREKFNRRRYRGTIDAPATMTLHHEPWKKAREKCRRTTS